MLSKLTKEKDIKNVGTKGVPHAVEKMQLVERSNWRTFKPVIDYSKCIKCGMCWLHCPDSAYNLNKEGFPECDGRVCKGCLLCLTVCPVKCISSVQERGALEKK